MIFTDNQLIQMYEDTLKQYAHFPKDKQFQRGQWYEVIDSGSAARIALENGKQYKEKRNT